MYNPFRSATRAASRATIERLYGAIVAQSRQPAFYTDLGVADTPEGRFEMVVLHTFLLCHRLKDGNERQKAVSQEVFDAFAADMDASLREMGVGDLTVPKKMKKIGAAFYGRTAAYDAALADPDPAALAAAVGRNIIETDPDHPRAQALGDYVRRAAAALAALPFAAIARGELTFPPPLAAGSQGAS